MGFIDKMRRFIDSISGSSTAINTFFLERKDNGGAGDLLALIDYVNQYKEDPTYGTYDNEMATRCAYLSGSMQADITELLKRQFPDTYLMYERDQINLKILRHIMLEKAQAFPETTQFKLVDRSTSGDADPGDPQAKAFQEMIEKGLVHNAARQIDLLTQTCHRSAGKAWWDDDRGCVMLSVYPPQDVLIVPSPYKPWSPQSAPAVLFRHHQQLNSLNGVGDVWEVWSANGADDTVAIDENGNPLWVPTTHYMTDGNKEWSVNQLDANPFFDLGGKQIVPFEWFTDDGGTALYPLGDEDLLDINRVVNWGMTALHLNVINQAFPYPYIRYTGSGTGEKLPEGVVLSPKHLIHLPEGYEIAFAHPDLDITQPNDFYERLVKMEALLSQVGSETVTLEAKNEESGRAIMLKQAKLNKHLSPLRNIYRSPFERMLEKMVIVRNTYRERAGLVEIDLRKYRPVVVFGEIQLPSDRLAAGEAFQLEKENNVSTSVDWLMHVNKLSREEAEAKVEANKEYNSAEKKAMRVYPVDYMEDDAVTRPEPPTLPVVDGKDKLGE